MKSSQPDSDQYAAINHPAVQRCLYCGQPAQLVWVHGHGQCVHCGINVDECCRGEHCDFTHSKREFS